MNLYQQYLAFLGPIPRFLQKYLSLPELTRLKDISLECGREYASKELYDFAFPINYYEHSLGTALLTWRLTHNKKDTLQALLHDIGIPCCAHSTLYIQGEYQKEILLSNPKIGNYLNYDRVSIAEIINFNDRNIVCLPHHQLSTNGIDQIIAHGFSWAQNLTLEEAQEIVDNLVVLNKAGKTEIEIENPKVKQKIMDVIATLKALMHTPEDLFIRDLLAKIMDRLIERGCLQYADLFKITDADFFQAVSFYQDHEHIEGKDYDTGYYDEELNSLWMTFQYVDEVPDILFLNRQEKSQQPQIYRL